MDVTNTWMNKKVHDKEVLSRMTNKFSFICINVSLASHFQPRTLSLTGLGYEQTRGVDAVAVSIVHVKPLRKAPRETWTFLTLTQ